MTIQTKRPVFLIEKKNVPVEVIEDLNIQHASNGGFLESNSVDWFPNGQMEWENKVERYRALKGSLYTVEYFYKS